LATVALPSAGTRRLGARVLTAVRGAASTAVRTAVRTAITPHKASLQRLADIPLTVAGTGCADFAAFHYIHMIGWAVTAVSLVVLEHLIADET
jgi:hypothetical protein